MNPRDTVSLGFTILGEIFAYVTVAGQSEEQQDMGICLCVYVNMHVCVSGIANKTCCQNFKTWTGSRERCKGTPVLVLIQM